MRWSTCPGARASAERTCGSARGQIAPEVFDQVARVVLRAVDEAGLAPAENRQSNRIEARRVDDAAVVAQVSLPVEDRHVEPAVIGTESGRPDDRADLPALQVEIEPGFAWRARRPEPV